MSREKIREQLFGPAKKYLNLGPKDLSKVKKIEEESILSNRTSIVDAVNLANKDIKRWMKFAHDNNIEIEHKNFEISLKEALKRNKVRKSSGEQVYNEKAIERLYRQSVDDRGMLPEWSYSPSRNEVYKIPINSPGRREVARINRELSEIYPIQGRQVAIIDVDGTLANNSHFVSKYLIAPPYKDYENFFKSIESSPVNSKVVRLMEELRRDGISSIILSGRTDIAAREMGIFLKENNVPASRVILRPNESNVRDFEFKKAAIKILEREGLVPVLAVDDRPRSIAVWEELGVPVEKVEWREGHSGDFEPLPEPEMSGRYSSGNCIKCGRALKSGTIGPTCRRKS